jgi:hypothetical protein
MVRAPFPTILRSEHQSWLDYLYWDIELEP